MKKYSILILILGLFILPAMAGAQAIGVRRVSETIVPTGLEAQVAQLREQLAALRANKPIKLVITESPSTLKVGETGVWKVRALRLSPFGELAMQSRWGDSPEIMIMRLPLKVDDKKNIHYRHEYSKPGVYEISFRAQVPNGQTALATTTVLVKY